MHRTCDSTMRETAFDGASIMMSNLNSASVLWYSLEISYRLGTQKPRADYQILPSPQPRAKHPAPDIPTTLITMLKYQW